MAALEGLQFSGDMTPAVSGKTYYITEMRMYWKIIFVQVRGKTQLISEASDLSQFLNNLIWYCITSAVKKALLNKPGPRAMQEVNVN